MKTKETLVESVTVVKENEWKVKAPPAITAELADLNQQCNALSTQFTALVNSRKLDGHGRASAWISPETVVNEHIGQLRKYNETKDLALGLVSMIADQRGITIKEVFKEMNTQPP